MFWKKCKMRLVHTKYIFYKQMHTKRILDSNAMVTNKTDIVRLQQFAHHRRISLLAWAPDDFKEFLCIVTYCTGAGRRLYNYDNIGRCPDGHRTMSYGARTAL